MFTEPFVPMSFTGAALILFFGVFVLFLFFCAVGRQRLLRVKIFAIEVPVWLVNFILIAQVFLVKNLVELWLRALLASVIAGISLWLIRWVRREAGRREETGQLPASLEQANQRLQELDKQKTEFLSIASHQLRTPLSILKGYIELIQEGVYGRPTKKLAQTLSDMDQSNERLIRLVDEFLNISRIEQGRTKYSFAASDMNAMLTSVVKELTWRAKAKGLALSWRPNARVGEVYMDEEKIRHVAFNFIDNAIKYSQRGKISVTLEADGCEAIVRVKDQGIGFNAKKDGVNFFHKFYRGDNVKTMSVDGTGLGIFVCRKFIEAHTGRVWAISRGVGRGSEFGFAIPVKQEGCSREVGASES